MLRELFWDLEELARSKGAHRRSPQHVVYEWRSWHNYYAQAIIPTTFRLRARLGETAGDVLRRIPDGVRSFLFHLDLSDCSGFMRGRDELVKELERLKIVALNARIADLRAGAVQRKLKQAGLPHVLAGREGEPDELLIVKSDYNYGGRSERLLSDRQRRLLGLADPVSSIRSKWDYRVYRRREISDAIWRNEGLAVQRFVSNSAGRLIRFRVSLDHWVGSPCVSGDAIKDVTRARGEQDRFLKRSEAPAEVRRAAELFGLDFGSIDTVADDMGLFHVIDINHTPGVADDQPGRLAWLRSAWKGDVEAARLP